MFIAPNRRLTRRVSFNLVWLLLLLAATAPAALADEIAVWNFNDSDLIVDHGKGTLATNLNAANVPLPWSTIKSESLKFQTAISSASAAGAVAASKSKSQTRLKETRRVRRRFGAMNIHVLL